MTDKRGRAWGMQEVGCGRNGVWVRGEESERASECDALYTFARRVAAGALCVCRVPARHVLEGGCCEPEAMACVGLRRGTLSALSLGDTMALACGAASRS
jgi:hypothetical protein